MAAVQPSAPPISFREVVSKDIEDPVSSEFMTRAVTLFPCGHILNEDTAIQCLALNKLCPLDRVSIERYVPNYTVRSLAQAASEHPQEEGPEGPSAEAQHHFQKGKALADQKNYEAAIPILLEALQISPGYEKAQAFLDFCLQHTAEPHPVPVPERKPFRQHDAKVSIPESSKEDYTNLLLRLLEEPQIQKHSTLVKIFGEQVEELMSQVEFTHEQQESYAWTQKLFIDQKVSSFIAKKLEDLHGKQQKPNVDKASLPSRSLPTPVGSVQPPSKKVTDTSREIFQGRYDKAVQKEKDYRGGDRREFDEAVSQWIARLKGKSEIEIDLIEDPISDAGISAFAEALKINSSIKYLWLKNGQIGDTDVSILAEALKINSSVTFLWLTGSQIGNAGAKAFAEVLKVNSSISIINLSKNQISDAGAIALAEALKVNSSITDFKLENNQIGNAGAIAFAEALKVNSSITDFKLENNQIGNAGAIAFAEALKVSSIININLNLTGNKIDLAQLKLIKAALKHKRDFHSRAMNPSSKAPSPDSPIPLYVPDNMPSSARQRQQLKKTLQKPAAAVSQEAFGVIETPTIASGKTQKPSSASRASLPSKSWLARLEEKSEIILFKKEIGDTDAIALAEALKVNRSITAIKLSCNQIGDAGAEALAEALKHNSSITKISLFGNQIGDSGVIALAEAIKVNRSITKIDLSCNKIGEAGAEALAEALKVNTTITCVDLTSNQIGAAGTKALAEALKRNSSITKICLFGNLIGDAGAKALAEALKVNTTITCVDLTSNQIGAAGAKALAKVLKVNTSITRINLRYNRIGDVGAKALAKTLKRNTSISTIDLSKNKIREAGRSALAKADKTSKRISLDL